MQPTIETEVHDNTQELTVGQLYSNDHIFKALKVANAGGIRLSLQDKSVRRAVIMTSAQELHVAKENPYHDRLESGILIYTAGGKIGQQTLAGANSRLISQRQLSFPIHGFVQVANRRDKSVGPRRWEYLGLLQYLRHYPDTQLDSHGKVRPVWLFEFKIHPEPRVISLALDAVISRELLTRENLIFGGEDDEVVSGGNIQSLENMERIEEVRSRLLGLEARKFEFFVKELLQHAASPKCVLRSLALMVEST